MSKVHYTHEAEQYLQDIKTYEGVIYYQKQNGQDAEIPLPVFYLDY